jgi:ketosteroid isomerase-like protein
MVELMHPDVEWRPALSVVPADGSAIYGTYQGHDGIRQWIADANQADDYRVEPKEFRDLGDQVLVTASLSLMVDRQGYFSEIFGVLAFRDGKVVSGVAYTSEAEALEAAGL